MRIITGLARGKRLQTAQGMHTRPTTDRVKESVFNIIQWDIEGRKVLDLFGGSGQLGLEALSRGAASCTIVEADRNAQKAIETNICSNVYWVRFTSSYEKFGIYFSKLPLSQL